MGKSKRGYNWKARQNSEQNATTEHSGNRPDTNQLVLLPSKRKHDQVESIITNKRSKLSSKQKKRLKKVIQAKEQKVKHKALVQSLQELALPASEMKLLTSSTSISRKRITKKEIQEKQSLYLRDSYQTSFSKRRRVRNRKKLRIEKILNAPEVTTPNQDCSMTSEDNSSVSSESEVEGIALDCPQEDKMPMTCVDKESERKTEFTITVKDKANAKQCTNQVSSVAPSNKQQNVFVSRTKEIQTSRLELPILSEEHVVMEAVQENDVIIVCGETGSGKTTQVPQFLYEAGYAHQQEKRCMIGITEPRRIAAITMSQRVAEEMSLSMGEVSYQIRYEGSVSKDTRMKFMTDGVLLKEIEQDFLLSNYSVIIIDEAHERSVFTDILVGLLSRIVPQRRKKLNPLKLIIMSATLRVDDFVSNKTLFSIPPPVITVDSRQFPVTVHFNRLTPSDYVKAAYVKVCKIHRELPSGHILVFVTGKAEVMSLCSRLKKTFSKCNTDKGQVPETVEVSDEIDCNEEDNVSSWIKKEKRKRRNDTRTSKRMKPHINIDLDNYPVVPPSKLMDSNNASEESSGEDDDVLDSQGHSEPMIVYPLYSMLPAEKQAEIFRWHSENTRVCVVSTNVAETSVTIPGIKYIVDSGKVKHKCYDKVTGASTFHITWISKASANQRAGRAGRTSAGHCYRLYSSAVYQHDFSEYSSPEITNRPVEDLVLQMKAMNIDKVSNFPFPTPPSPIALKTAEELLVQLGALAADNMLITPLGSTLSHFPISPRYSKMLCLSNQNNCLPYMIIMVAALSVPELYVCNDIKTKRTWAGQGECYLLGDLMVLLRTICAYDCCRDKDLFCQQHGLRAKGIAEIRKLRQQLTNIVNTVCVDVNCHIDPNLPPPTQHQAKLLRQMVLAGHGDHVARKISTNEMNAEDKKKLKYAYETPMFESPVFLHPSSVLHSCPPFVVYQELLETNKLFMREVTAIEEEWLPVVVPELCTFSSPMETPPPRYDPMSDKIMCHMTSSFGPWDIVAQELPFPNTVEKYKHFAKFLLEGKVIDKLAVFSDCLLAPPITMVKKWGRLQKRTEVLLSSLVAMKVASKYSLMDVWNGVDPKFLLSAYSMWIPQSMHGNLSDIWPPNEDLH